MLAHWLQTKQIHIPLIYLFCLLQWLQISDFIFFQYAKIVQTLQFESLNFLYKLPLIVIQLLLFIITFFIVILQDLLILACLQEHIQGIKNCF